MMDSWFLSALPESAAAGVGALMPVLGTVFMAIQAFSQAGASIASQFLGGNTTGTRASRRRWLSRSFLLGIAMTFLIYPSSGEIIR